MVGRGGEVLVENDGGEVLAENDGGEVLAENDGGEVLVENDGEVLVENDGGEVLVENDGGEGLVENGSGFCRCLFVCLFVCNSCGYYLYKRGSRRSQESDFFHNIVWLSPRADNDSWQHSKSLVTVARCRDITNEAITSGVLNPSAQAVRVDQKP